jgi:hypothetical protein
VVRDSNRISSRRGRLCNLVVFPRTAIPHITLTHLSIFICHLISRATHSLIRGRHPSLLLSSQSFLSPLISYYHPQDNADSTPISCSSPRHHPPTSPSPPSSLFPKPVVRRFAAYSAQLCLAHMLLVLVLRPCCQQEEHRQLEQLKSRWGGRSRMGLEVGTHFVTVKSALA